MGRSTGYLPVWLQKAMSAPHPTRVHFSDASYVSVFPDEGRYDSNVQDWAQPTVISPEEAPLTFLLVNSIKPQGQPLIGLCWHLLVQHLAQLQRQPPDYPFRFQMVRLLSWPSLSHVPQDIQLSMARLCALLARKPSVASLLPLLLKLPESQVFMLIEALHLHGHVQVSDAVTDTVARLDRHSFSDMPAAEATEEIQPAVRELIANIWKRLRT